jgi:hypothetical protein
MIIRAYPFNELIDIDDGAIMREGLSGARAILSKDSDNPIGKIVFINNKKAVLLELEIPRLKKDDWLIVTNKELKIFNKPDLNMIACLKSGHYPPKTSRVNYGQKVGAAIEEFDAPFLDVKKPFLTGSIIMIDGIPRELNTDDLLLPINKPIHITLIKANHRDVFRRYYRFVPHKEKY